MFASVLFLLFAIIGLSGNISFRVPSCSMSDDRKCTAYLMSLHIGLNLTGKTVGCFTFYFVVVSIVSLMEKG